MSTANASRPRLTVAVLARNEEACLPKALASVARIADELLVIDTGSTDQTKAVAVQQGARVIDHPWQNDFSTARNAGMAAANGSWVLWLDASEWLTATQAQSVRMLLDAQEEPNKAWLLYVE